MACLCDTQRRFCRHCLIRVCAVLSQGATPPPHVQKNLDGLEALLVQKTATQQTMRKAPIAGTQARADLAPHASHNLAGAPFSDPHIVAVDARNACLLTGGCKRKHGPSLP